MKKIKNLVLVLALFLCFNGCEKNQEEMSTMKKASELTVEQAKAFVEVQRMNEFILKSGNLQKQTVKIRADWEKAKCTSDENVSVVETEIQAMGGFGFATSESMDAWKSTNNDNYLSSLSRLVVIKQKKTGEVFSFIMSVVADKPYFEIKHFKLWENTYLKRDKNLTGYVLFHSLTGEFVNGWIYCDGQITNSIIQPKNLDLPIDLKSAKMMVAIYEWVQECTDWWTVAVGYEEVNITHRVSCKDVYTYVGSYSTDGSTPPGGGGYTPPTPQPCNCDICPICGGCIDLLKSADLPTNGSTTTTTSTPCPVCIGHAAPLSDPKIYSPQSGDKLSKVGLSSSMSMQLPNTCVTSIMQYINNSFCGGSTNQGVYILDYLNNYGINVLGNGVELGYIEGFVNAFFNTEPFGGYQQAIDNGRIVMADVASNIPNSSHNVAVVGYHPDGTIIYMDPEKGCFMEAPASKVGMNYTISINGCK